MAIITAPKPATSSVVSASKKSENKIQILKEREWVNVEPPEGLEEELYKSLKEYEGLLNKEKEGTSTAVGFSVKRDGGLIQIEQRGLFGWLNFGTKNHPFTIIFQPKMMYGLDLYVGTDLGKFSNCLFNMKIISNEMIQNRGKRKKFIERAFSQGTDEREFNIDLLEEIFTSRLEEALSEGVARKYVRKTISHPYLKGKIIPSMLIPNLWTEPGYLNQDVQELSPNILVNRLLAWCCNYLINERRNLSNELNQRLNIISQRFKGVEIWGRPNENDLERLENLPPIHSYLQGAVDIAIMIAREEINHLDNKESRAKATGWVVDANLTFEDFVGYIFQRVCPETETQHSQVYARVHPDADQLKDNPDIYIPSFGEAGRNIRMTFDAKHSRIKRTTERDYRNQTITAAWSRDCQICGLVFPQGDNGKEHFKIWKLDNNTNAPNCYAQISLDPSKLSEEECVEKQQDRLEEQLWELHRYHHVEMKLREKNDMAESWKGETDESDYNNRLNGIEEAFEGEQWEESYDKLQELLSLLP